MGTLLQITTTIITIYDRYYNSRQLLFQFMTGITIHDVITIHDSTHPTRVRKACVWVAGRRGGGGGGGEFKSQISNLSLSCVEQVSSDQYIFLKENRKNRLFSLLLLWCGWRIPREHLFVTCHFTATLWEKLIVCCNNVNIKAQSLSIVDIIFGDWQRKDYLVLLNHIILIGKQYIYYCRIYNSKPLFLSIKTLKCSFSTN